MMEPQTSTNISTRLERIAKLAKDARQMVFRALAHHIDVDLLREAYRLTRKDGAVGVDGQRATEYATELESNLKALLDRAKSGTYFAPPVRRVHIPKGDGKETRPLGIPTFEDKVLQRAEPVRAPPRKQERSMQPTKRRLSKLQKKTRKAGLNVAPTHSRAWPAGC